MILLDIDITYHDIYARAKKIVESIYNVDDISTKSRKGQYVKARRMFIYEMYFNQHCTLDYIGKYLGDLDHTTVLHHRDLFRDELMIYPDVKANYNQFREMLYGRMD